jgi:probable rRNA maturation factor
MHPENFSLSNTTKGKLPRLPFAQIKDLILSPSYELSVAVVDATTMRTLNNTWRQKDYATNILSFPYDKKSGEIVLHLPAIKKDASEFDLSFEEFTRYLYVHGLLHLKGMHHGATMDTAEKKFLMHLSATLPLHLRTPAKKTHGTKNTRRH